MKICTNCGLLDDETTMICEKCNEKVLKVYETKQTKEILEDLDNIRAYSDKWDYNLCTPFWDTIKKYEERLKKK